MATLSVMPGAAVDPSGDVIEADVAREAVNEVITRLRAIGVEQQGSISMSTPTSWLSRRGVTAQERAPGAPADAVVWNDVVQKAYDETAITWTYLSFMVLATLLAGGRRGAVATADARVGGTAATTRAARTTARGDDRADRRKGETKNRTALNEVAAVDLSLGERLDEIELGCIRLAAERIQFLEIGHTSSLLRSRCISAEAETPWLSHTTSV